MVFWARMIFLALLASWSQIAHAHPDGNSLLYSRGVSTGNVQKGACAGDFQPTSFVFDNAFYIRYEVSHDFDTQPNSTQFVFDVSNESNGVLTGCSFYQVMVDGKYPDTFSRWTPCYDRTLDIDGHEISVKTSARAVLDNWGVSVNQSWSCVDGCAPFSSPCSLTT